ncbi:MAG: maleylpyruvate isomerase N-terminal domain-containing protein [Chloroflexota bacterium]
MQFATQQYTDDFTEFESALAEFLHHVPADGWSNPTGTRDKDWTLHETLAHVVSVARLFNEAMTAALAEKPLVLPNFIRREDLREWNIVQIAALVKTSPADLMSMLFKALNAARDRAKTLSPEQMAMTIALPVYNRPVPVRDLIDFQLSHAGIVHAAQLPRAIDAAPLWTRYSDPLTRRQLDRFMRHFSVAYWNTLAPEQHVTINMVVEHPAEGGAWHLVAAPDGGRAGDGKAADADYTVTFTDANALFGVFTVAVPLKEALSSGAMTTSDDWRTVFKVLRLFSATPPG